MKNTVRLQMLFLTFVIMAVWAYISIMIGRAVLEIPAGVVAVLLISVGGKTVEKLADVYLKITGKKVELPSSVVETKESSASKTIVG